MTFSLDTIRLGLEQRNTCDASSCYVAQAKAIGGPRVVEGIFAEIKPCWLKKISWSTSGGREEMEVRVSIVAGPRFIAVSSIAVE